MRTQSGSGWSLISFFFPFFYDDETQGVGPGGRAGGREGGL